MKTRIDLLLVARGLFDSRAKARAAIEAGLVTANGTAVAKASELVDDESDLAATPAHPFVGRGALKLDHALTLWPITVEGRTVLDVGASTGGFTDCALQAGAASVTCVDVGRAQLHGKLLADPRVTNLEQINARHLDPASLPRPSYDAVMMDLSFISLRHVLPPVWPALRPGGTLVALVKPQFEAGKAEVDKGQGVIRDPAIQQRVLDDIRAFALAELPGATLVGTIDSPITGTDGNREFLLGLLKQPA